MRLGIDLGTTRTLVAVVDRGNYPVVTFENLSGEFQEWHPSVIARNGDELRFGFDALEVKDDPNWQILRSFKRLLGNVSPSEELFGVPALHLLTEYVRSVRRDLLERSNHTIEEPLECVVGVPANANSNQRFLTLEAFREAGMRVVGVLNEPSAAGIEYANRYRRSSLSKKRENLLVYDLGGGTFDTSVINMTDDDHSVITSLGISHLGGNDFDDILLEMAEGPAGDQRLLDVCRTAKEKVTANTKRIALSLGDREVLIPVEDFYERCRPLVERTIHVVRSACATAGGEDLIGCIYMVGGASDFPLVSRMLRDAFGRRVRRSPYPHAATAIGLAIAADERTPLQLEETFTRHFGVWRETESGNLMVFDPIFPKDSPVPNRVTRHYRPAHNIGHFRYLECGEIDERGRPGGDITPWDVVLFPFDPTLVTPVEQPLIDHKVTAAPRLASQEIREIYTCDAKGIVEATIRNETAGYERRFRLRA